MVKDNPISPQAQHEAQVALAKAPCALPLQVNSVLESLPFCADRATIQKTLEECNGSVHQAVSQLIENQSQSSASSRRGSSSVERDHDSDEDEFSGPKKKQDRRLSRVKRAIKDEENPSNHYLSVRLKSPLLPSTQESVSTSDTSSNATDIKDGDDTEEEDWRNNPPFKDSESASVSTSASEYSAPSKPRSGGVRLKLSQPKKRDEDVKPPVSSPTQRSPARTMGSNEVVTKPNQHLAVPKRRLVSRNQLDGLRKATQKAAAKERKREVAAERVANQQPGSFFPTTLKGKADTPAIENHIKVLYI